ncbi:hypothetical protein IGI04_001294 [Brassica rapa subsp. trilocularis]|uniref:Gnk2-homologous domain-containing protein n=1 Tax=Brassica rapa subsp. trilocularis TaxID=1813537 RepID=A0ABQ7NS84_BRACM|nr:hypothetical protein IGI04_001294 [Brassica rapa subsp. trilocularis]
MLQSFSQDPTYVSHVCPNTATYSRNSTYFTNLRTLLSFLSSPNASYATGFQNATVGEPPDRVIGYFTCFGVSPELCRRCVAFSVEDALIRCPNEKEVTLYYDQCMLRYSNRRDVPSEKGRPQRIKRERFPWCVLLLGVEGHSEALSDGVRCGLSLVRFGVNGVRWVLTYLVKYFRGGGRLKPRLRGSLAKAVSLKRSVKIAAVEDSVLRCSSCIARVSFVCAWVIKRFGVTGVCWVLTYLVKYFRGGGRLKPRLRESLAKAVSLKRSVKIAAVEDSVLRCGTFPSGVQVAVKRLSKTSGQGEKSLKMKLLLWQSFSTEICGYMSPEYAMYGQFSMKSDVYSFGVLVLEIISGKKNSNLYQIDGSAGNLVTYTWRLWSNGSPLELVDPSFQENYQTNEITRCIHIALLCVQEEAEDRPTMSAILQMLTTSSISLAVPRPPGFFFRIRHEQAGRADPAMDMSALFSVDDASITSVAPR